jgi:uncharacterized membrane protein
MYWLAFLLGVVAGLRALMVPAAVSWVARLGLLQLGGTWLAFLGYAATPWILTALALGELVTDQLPSTPSRTTPPQFLARLVTAAIAGAALCAPHGAWPGGAAAAVVGAYFGARGGHAARARLAKAFGRDRPAALIEDVVAIGGVLLILAVAV